MDDTHEHNIIEDTLEKLSFDTPDEYKSTCSSSSSITETLLEVTRSLKLIESRAERTLSEVSFPTKLDNETQDIDEAKMIALKKSIVQKRLAFLNQASKEELEGLKGIGKKRATDVLEFCKENPEPFKSGTRLFSRGDKCNDGAST